MISLRDNAKDINFAHFYFSPIKLSKIERFAKVFKNFYLFDMENLPQKIPNIDILFIEIDSITKEKFLILNTLVKKYTSKCIYLYSNTPENSFLLKFALHFSLNKVLEIKDDEVLLKAHLEEALKRYIIKQNELQQVEISKQINTFFALLAFKNNKLVYANEKAFEIFAPKTLSDIENKLNADKNIQELLLAKKNSNKMIFLANEAKEEWKYNFYLNVLDNGVDKFVSIIPHKKLSEKEVEFATLNRFKFIEYLKDKLVQNFVNLNEMSLILINISNYDKITRASGTIKVHDFIKKFILQLLKHKEPYQEITQWNPHCFILLVENEKFENVKEKLDSLHQKLVYADIDEDINAIVNSSAMNIQTDDINEIIAHVENISNESIQIDEFDEDEYFEINHLNDYMSESEQIFHYLYSCIANKTNLKLLNIYKGLCINTKSKVLRVEEDSFFLSFEVLQGYSMQTEGQTLIQSPDLPHDISADVSYVNFEKSFVLLDNFRFLKSSANNREHTRVQPGIRTPLMLKYERLGYQGEILDMSINAIAAKFSRNVSHQLLHKKVSLNFKLPDKKYDFGFVEMRVQANTVFIGEHEDKYTKVVFILDELKKPYDSHMFRYMYARQKELILELKRAVKVKANVKI